MAILTLVAACTGPTLTPTPTPTQSPTPTPTHSPSPLSGAQLIVFPSGTIDKVTCDISSAFGGCPAIMVIAPGLDWRPPGGWLPADQDVVFSTTERPEGWVVTGPGDGLPAMLAVGDYTIALGIAEYNDVIDAPERFAAARLLCQENLTVTAQAVSVSIDAVFGAECQIRITTD